MDFEKLSDVKFELKKDESRGMRTNVVVYATQNMLEKIRNDRTIQQAVNATTLPGLVGDVLVMPDGHEGYGFPVGGVAAFDANDGIISPGAVGYDINCLHPGTRVYDVNGSWHRIDSLRSKTADLLSFDASTANCIKTNAVLWIEKQCDTPMLHITTSLGKEILATEDHPILTDKGMVDAGKLKAGDRVISTGFEGLEFTEPENRVILSGERIAETLRNLGITERGNAITQVLNVLRRLGLNRIDLNHPKLPILLKLLGLVFGDGTIPNTKGGISYTKFYGKEKDLIKVREDIQRLGFKASLHHRSRHHKINTAYGMREFNFEEYSLSVGSAAFSSLLVCLGAPFGNKSALPYRVPEWVMNADDWQKRLFVSAYFGAEMSKPHTHNGYNFETPAFSVNKLEELGSNAVAFLRDIANVLNSLGVQTAQPAAVEGYRYIGKKGKTLGFRLHILSNTENLIRFFSSVGYLYNDEKERIASLAALYLRYLIKVRSSLDELKARAVEMKLQGVENSAIVRQLANDGKRKSFIEHTVLGRGGAARVWKDMKFEDFTSKLEIGKSGLVYDTVESCEIVPYEGKVFDLTINQETHNFIANGIVVSNCGVRLVKTNLTEKEVRPKIGALLDALFKNVPTGVGSRLKTGFTEQDLKKIAEEGAAYAIGKGFGWKDDVEKIEENGTITGADFSKVSREARSRGSDELGTLGAGNHFLEVQKVEKIFDERTAKEYGLFRDQVVVMVHCGSRGFGHQICSDYLRTLTEYQAKNNIQLIDRELSYAKIGSKEADNYLGAMNSAVNYAFANRQMIMHNIRRSFEEAFGKRSDEMGMELLYDVAHNIAKLEEHQVDGKRRAVYVHRKGATRAFPRNSEGIPKEYKGIGQPVIIPGSMGTSSYILCGEEGSMRETFGTTCHGSGRLMSRHQALREISAEKTFESLKSKGIEIRVRTRKLISEEAEWVYKNVDEVVGVVEKAGISRIVSKNVPIGVVKG